MRIGVFGAGAWGTALAIAFARDHDVRLWGRESGLQEAMRRERKNERYLPGADFPTALSIETEFASAAHAADLFLIVTPLAGLRETAQSLRRIDPAVPVLWACKGIDPLTCQLPHEIAADELAEATPRGVLTGPSFAAEVARNQPTAVTIASPRVEDALAWSQHLHQARLRIYANDDVVGAEVGGAVKNVMAIAAGISDGLGFGLNARAALITRGLAEMARLGAALGGKPETLMGLAGMGDLVLTCTGDLSRNRRVGLALATGQTLPAILADLGHVAEGVSTAQAVDTLARRRGVDMPITAAVAAVLRGEASPDSAVEALLARDPKAE
ncbi:MAG: NAD(P)-dependent glycerol-3-phosphate dehydrogenase [Zoogloeaceae bacterium]|nr:NAD(P)-dependent glycerol-3-phosphate dehydrogenase [Zoogloeaceae bacterium]